MTTECPYTLQCDAPSPSKLPISMGDLGPHLIHDSFGNTPVLNPNGISIGSAVFAGLTSVTDTDGQTNHATRSVTLDSIYVRSTDCDAVYNNIFVRNKRLESVIKRKIKVQLKEIQT